MRHRTHTTLRRGLGAGLAMILLGATSACSESPVANPVEVLVYAVWDPGTVNQGGDATALDGRLDVRNGCLVVVGADDRMNVPIFPNRFTSWNADDSVLLVGSAAFPLGRALSLGGGERNDPRSDEDIFVPRACRDAPAYFLVYSVGIFDP